EIEREMRDVELPRYAARIGEIVDRAASSIRRIGVREVVVHLHRQTDHLMSLRLEDVCGSRGVDPAGHGNGDLHLQRLKPRALSRCSAKALKLHDFPSIKVQSAVSVNEVKAVRVLVVDDDPSIRRMIMAALRRDGYSFSEAAN